MHFLTVRGTRCEGAVGGAGMDRKRVLPRKQNTVLIYHSSGGVYPSGGKCLCLEEDAVMDPDGEAALVRTVRPSGSAEGKANCSAGEIHRNSEFG